MPNIKPQEDFYYYVNYEWDKKNKIPQSYSKWSVFQELHEKSLRQMDDIISKSNNDFIQILKKQYLSKKYDDFLIEKIKNIKSKDELISYFGQFNHFHFGNLLNVYIIPDMKNSNYNILGVYPSLLLLPEKEYFVEKKKNQKELEKLEEFVKDLFNHLKVKQSYKPIYEIQTKVSKKTMSKEDRRIPEKGYNIYTLQKLKKEFHDFNWELFFKACNISNVNEIIVEDVEQLKEFVNIMNNYSLTILKNFFLLKYIISVSDLLDDKIEKKIFNFYAKFLSGTKKMKSKKKRCTEFLSHQLGEIISQEYVKNYFSEKSKLYMIKIVKNLKNAYKKRLIKVSWMDDQTKKKAVIKLQKMKYKIGYPDFFKNYTKIDINLKNSFIQNIMNINQFEYHYEMSFLYKKPDPKTWEIMPHEINAYYHPLKNEIVFPAGILQKPFFDLSLSLPEIYGGIGAIIGHEITHGFDDQGKKFDENGNLNNWWTKNDEIQYNKNAQKIIKQFNNFTIQNLKVNGTLTQGENIADLGGLLISLDALKFHKKDFTDKDIKLFFESWASNWRYKITKKQLKKNLLIDSHSPNYFRVNGPVIHIDDFHKVYKTSVNDKMFLSKNKRINIW